MRRFRFHIGTLVILVLLFAVSFAALRDSSEIWDGITFTLTVGLLLTSILLAIHRTERKRAFWLGFALFGVTFLGLSLIPSIESRLLTTKGLAYLHSKMPRSNPNGVGFADFDNDGDIDIFVTNYSQANALYVNKGNGTFQDVTTTVGLNSVGNQGTTADMIFVNTPSGMWLVGSTENFIHIGLSLCALIVAFLGGQLSRRLYNKDRQLGSGSANRLASNSDVSRS
jgi:hypothetical protein